MKHFCTRRTFFLSLGDKRSATKKKSKSQGGSDSTEFYWICEILGQRKMSAHPFWPVVASPFYSWHLHKLSRRKKKVRCSSSYRKQVFALYGIRWVSSLTHEGRHSVISKIIFIGDDDWRSEETIERMDVARWCSHFGNVGWRLTCWKFKWGKQNRVWLP